MNITPEHEVMLARLTETAKTPEAYQAMLDALPDNVKRTFVEMDPGAIREYSVRNVKRQLADKPELAKLLDAVAVRQIIDQVYSNIIEDQKRVKATMGQDVDGSSRADSGRYRTVRR